MGDLFHEDVPNEYIVEVFDMMVATPQHTYLLLTKRPERMAKLFRLNGPFLGNEPLKNAWLGTSVENQAAADERIPILLGIPAAIHYVSYEPGLGAVDLAKACYGEGHNRPSASIQAAQCVNPLYGLDWVIAGGETGPGARPCNPNWVRKIRDDCQAAGTPFFFKGWGGWGVKVVNHLTHKQYAGQLVPYTTVCSSDRKSIGEVTYHAYPADVVDNDFRDIEVMERMGKKRAGRVLDGRTWDEVPANA
jgi:protein gp37